MLIRVPTRDFFHYYFSLKNRVLELGFSFKFFSLIQVLSDPQGLSISQIMISLKNRIPTRGFNSNYLDHLNSQFPTSGSPQISKFFEDLQFRPSGFHFKSFFQCSIRVPSRDLNLPNSSPEFQLLTFGSLMMIQSLRSSGSPNFSKLTFQVHQFPISTFGSLNSQFRPLGNPISNFSSSISNFDLRVTQFFNFDLQVTQFRPFGRIQFLNFDR